MSSWPHIMDDPKGPKSLHYPWGVRSDSQCNHQSGRGGAAANQSPLWLGHRKFREGDPQGGVEIVETEAELSSEVWGCCLAERGGDCHPLHRPDLP